PRDRMPDNVLKKPPPATAAERFALGNPAGLYDFLRALRYAVPVELYDQWSPYIAHALTQAVGLPLVEAGAEDASCDAEVEALRRDGLAEAPVTLDAEAVGQARAHLARFRVRDAWDRVPGEWPLDAVPMDVNVAAYDSAAAKTCLPLMMLANHPQILARVTKLLGALPTIDNVGAWWSLPGRKQAKDAQLFHIDRVCYRFVKLFIYLTDVDMDSGPHVYVAGSHLHMQTRRRLEEMKKTGSKDFARFAAMYQSVRKDDRDVFDFFGDDKVHRLVGPAGSSFLVNVGGYHKGELPKTRSRLIFECTYSLLPRLRGVYQAVANPAFFDAAQARYGDRVSREQLAYINRLVVTP
ncbi:MAG TPA: hypothetical protein VGE72_27380, partial [Azospirillum sp.]